MVLQLWGNGRRGRVNDDKSPPVAARETAVIDSRYLKAYLRGSVLARVRGGESARERV